MDSKKLALICRELADNRKAENIVVLDVHEISSVTDYFVVASGTSEPHLRAITSEITDRLRDEHQLRPRAVDGTLQTSWVVLDFFDVIVHVMRTDVRERYNLEGLWGDAPQLDASGEAPKAKAKVKAPRKPRAKAAVKRAKPKA
ncbi:MAG: iojap-like protein [Pedosphaera sp.]|jgi:ribosome silencing factor RsfS/YbeB/iojap|nr:iojap-like protein [Pedosphaera sp.]